MATNSLGETIVPPNVSATELSAFIHDQAIPQLAGAAANLAKIPANFVVNIASNETTVGAVTLDRGDALMLRAQALALQVLLYSVTSWNAEIQLTAIKSALDDEDMTVERFLEAYPNLLGAASAADVDSARTAFTAAVAAYLDASNFIRLRPLGAERLFNYDPDSADNEARFRSVIEDLRTSLNGPVILRSDSKKIVHAAKFFELGQAPRRYFPAASGDYVVAGTMPDTTFGGIIGGVSLAKVEEALTKYFSLISMVRSVSILSDGKVRVTVNVPPGERIAVDVSSDLESWREVYVGLTHGLSSLVFEDPEVGLRQRFYRAVQEDWAVTSVFIMDALNNSWLPAGMITVYPGGSVYRADSWGWAEVPRRFAPDQNDFTIVVSAPGYDPKTIIGSRYWGYSVTLTRSDSPGLTLNRALDTGFSLETYGWNSWYPQATVAWDGLDAARSGAIGNFGYSVLTTRVLGPGTVRFRWKVSSQAGFDFLRFSVDGVDVQSISGEVDWKQISVPVGPGPHQIEWRYSKDGSISAGSDAGWVDHLEVIN